MRKSVLGSFVAAGMFLAMSAQSQTGTGWTLDGEKLAYVANDGSGVMTFLCDPESNELIISAITGPGTGWIQISTDNGARIALPAPGTARNGAIEGKLSFRDPFVEVLAAANAITVSTAAGTALSVDVPPAFHRITTSCP